MAMKKVLIINRNKKRNKQKLLLLFLILILFAVDYPFINKALNNWLVDYELGIVERVVDGDTLVVNGTSVRLLGINTPERGEKYYQEAKEFLENLTLNKLVRLERGKEDRDLYNRSLRYISVGGENVNLRLVEEGFANFYFPEGKDRHYNGFKDAWESCIEKNVNLCESSEDKCASCVILKNFNLKEQSFTLKNNCGFSCGLDDWSVKDEGRKNFIFPHYILEEEVEIKVGEEKNTDAILYWGGESYVWTKTGDSLFLRDEDNKLVLWHSY
jgi:micrococcal nuclease